MKIIRRAAVCAVVMLIVGLPLATSRPSFSIIALSAAGSPRSSVLPSGSAARAMPLGLPSEEMATTVLNKALQRQHPQWLEVPMGSTKIKVFAIFPDLAGKAPVVVVTAHNQGLTDWIRAVGTQVVSEGYMTIVPDLLSGLGRNGGGTDSFSSPEAVALALAQLGPAEIEQREKTVRDYFLSWPGANGRSALIDLNLGANKLETAIETPTLKRVVQLDLSEHAWHNALALLTSLADPAAAVPQGDAAPQPKDDAASAASAARQRAATQEIAKRDDIPPQANASPGRRADESPRHGQWVDIPAKTTKGPVKLHMWVVQPLGNNKAGLVLLIHPGPGPDNAEPPQKGRGANWIRGVADKIAQQGFIVVMPDFASGLGPNGGNFDSFMYTDEVFKALATVTVPDRLELVKAALEYGLKLPRANGKTGITGFCNGGGLAWASTAAIPGINAAVSFYGAPPELDQMAQIKAPVLAFAGDDDPALAPRVTHAAADMQRLGKSYEFKIYPNATHAFLDTQFLGENAVASLDAWPRAMEFFKRYLSNS